MNSLKKETATQPSPALRLLTVRNVAIFALVALIVGAAFSIKVVKTSDAQVAETFDPAVYAQENYESAIAPAIVKSAVDLNELLTAISADGAKAKADFGHSSSPYNAFSYPVTLTGVAGDPNEKSVPLTVAGLPSGTTVELMIAPGTSTAIRDVTGQVNLNQFLNQTEYLNASLELNKLVVNTVIDPFLKANPPATLAGKTLKITGTFTDRSNDKVQIIPVSIEVVP